MLSVEQLRVQFPVTGGTLLRRKIGEVKAVDGVSFAINKGDVLGLVGESGCGKTTVAKSILKLQQPTSGCIKLDGADIWQQSSADEKAYRRRVQAIFQDPTASLNPRMKIRDIVGEPLLIHEPRTDYTARLRRVGDLLAACGLPARFADLYPHEMSGGQRQRVGIARALALNPELIVCDEAVSALDVSIQAQIINLLIDLKDEFSLTYLFIGHDLSVVRHLCDRVAVMYLGKIVEIADSENLFESAQHPYTRSLLMSVPIPDPVIEAQRTHVALSGEVPSPMNPPGGCVFHPRCPVVMTQCDREIPVLQFANGEHAVACWATQQTQA